MKQDLTYIAMLLDRSGSMSRSEDDVVGGVNTFLDQQKLVTGSAIVTIAKFDTRYEVIYEDTDLQAARHITRKDFVPEGGTALNDSMMRLINSVGAKLASMKEEERPGQVIFLIFSDGGENSSKEISPEVIQKKVKQQESEYSWKFLFFGMDIDASAVGGEIGVRGFTGTKSSGGIVRAAKAASAYVGNSRLGNHQASELMYASRGVGDAGMTRGIEEFEKAISADPNPIVDPDATDDSK